MASKPPKAQRQAESKARRQAEQDVAAEMIAGRVASLVALRVAEAVASVQAERERCARLVEAASGDFSADICRELARRIRG